MKTSLWVVVVLVAGIVGFLIGYSVSSRTGDSSRERIEAAQEKAPQPPQAAAAPATAAPATAAAAPAAPAAGGYGEKPAAPAAGGYGEKPAAPAPSSATPPAKPAQARKAAPRKAVEKAGGTTGGY